MNFDFGFSAEVAREKVKDKLKQILIEQDEKQKKIELKNKQEEDKKKEEDKKQVIENLKNIFVLIEKLACNAKNSIFIYRHLHPIEQQYLKEQNYSIKEEYEKIKKSDEDSFSYTVISWKIR